MRIMIQPKSAKDFFCAEDYAWLCGLVEHMYSLEDDYVQEVFDGAHGLAVTCTRAAGCIIEGNMTMFESMVENHDPRYFENPIYKRMALLGLEYGVACENGPCANYLGALYYLGNVVEQDYQRAEELFELAERTGSVQSTINLGYIYEYGRTGEPDYQKAFFQYAKAAAGYDSSEALYKLGDMYGRGQACEKDLHMAYLLYKKSLDQACGEVEAAQPAIRIAKLVEDSANRTWGIPYNPVRAFELYQMAELGLRIDIARGQTYYRKRLDEAVEGQQRMRQLFEEDEELLLSA